MTKLEVLKLLQELLKNCYTCLDDGDQSWPATRVVEHETLCDKIAAEIYDLEHP